MICSNNLQFRFDKTRTGGAIWKFRMARQGKAGWLFGDYMREECNVEKIKNNALGWSRKSRFLRKRTVEALLADEIRYNLRTKKA